MFLQNVSIHIPEDHSVTIHSPWKLNLTYRILCYLFLKQRLTAGQTHKVMYSDMHNKSVLTTVNVAA